MDFAIKTPAFFLTCNMTTVALAIVVFAVLTILFFWVFEKPIYSLIYPGETPKLRGMLKKLKN